MNGPSGRRPGRPAKAVDTQSSDTPDTVRSDTAPVSNQGDIEKIDEIKTQSGSKAVRKTTANVHSSDIHRLTDPSCVKTARPKKEGQTEHD